MEFRKQSHATYYAQYHLVLVTKYRRKVLRAGTSAYCVAVNLFKTNSARAMRSKFPIRQKVYDRHIDLVEKVC